MKIQKYEHVRYAHNPLAEVICQVRFPHAPALLARGLEQTAGYMDRCGAEEGHLVIFDREPTRTWDEKIFTRAESHAGRAIQLWGI